MSTKALVKASESFPSVFEDFFKPWNEWFNGGVFGKSLTVPAVNITENKEDYKLSVAAPGLKKDDFKINLDKNVLSISAEKKTENTEEGKKYNRREYSYTSFVRSFTLPETADQNKIEAEYTDGVLKITAAKKEEAKNLTRQISLK